MNQRPASETQALAWDHLRYEIEMVAGLVWRISRQHALLIGPLDDLNPLRAELLDLSGRNADIEAFGLHVRLLVDFFYPNRKKPNDADAADFFDDPMVWKRARRKTPPSLKSVKGRVGMEMAHLSYDRPAPSVPWDYKTIWADLSGVIRDFIDAATVDRLGADFIERVRQILDAKTQVPAAVRLADAYADVTNWVPADVAPGPGTATSAVSYPFSDND